MTLSDSHLAECAWNCVYPWTASMCWVLMRRRIVERAVAATLEQGSDYYQAACSDLKMGTAAADARMHRDEGDARCGATPLLMPC